VRDKEIMFEAWGEWEKLWDFNPAAQEYDRLSITSIHKVYKIFITLQSIVHEPHKTKTSRKKTERTRVRSKVELKNHNWSKSGRHPQLVRRKENQNRSTEARGGLPKNRTQGRATTASEKPKPTDAGDERKTWQEFKSRTAAESWQQADEKSATRKSVKTEANQGLGERAERLRHRWKQIYGENPEHKKPREGTLGSRSGVNEDQQRKITGSNSSGDPDWEDLACAQVRSALLARNGDETELETLAAPWPSSAKTEQGAKPAARPKISEKPRTATKTRETNRNLSGGKQIADSTERSTNLTGREERNTTGTREKSSEKHGQRRNRRTSSNLGTPQQTAHMR
jgi:hypothetical protein